MTETLSVKYGTNISKKSLRKTLLEADPEGVMLRRKKVLRRRMHYTDWPGHIFHKHGRADGFIRNIMWLVTSNNYPLLVVSYS